MTIAPGDVISGKFRIDKTLGEGGMGVVMAATHVQLGQRVALKFLQKEALENSEIRARFMREARAAGRIRSAHAAKVLDVGSLDDGAPYIVMEYLEGLDLSTLLRKKGRLPASDVAEYILQACEALGEAHELGIVHRDLKPANLFLTTGPGGRPLVKVLDFGVSKIRPKIEPGADLDGTMPGGKPRPGVVPDDSVVTRVTDLLGSPNYMAPEQLLSSRDADAQSDIWSLGVIMYRLVTGIMPFPAEDSDELVFQVTKGPIAPLREYASTLPSGFDAVVARCMERDKSRRFASVADLARALAPYAPDNPTPSLERIALLGPEAEEGGTEVMPGAHRSHLTPISQHPHSRPTPISQHPHSRPTPISRNTPRSVPSGPKAESPWSAVASQPLPQIVPAEPPREERATAYLAIAAGLVVIVGVAVAMWRIRQPAHVYTPPEALPTAASVRPTAQPSLAAPTVVPTGAVHTVPPSALSSKPLAPVTPAGHRPKPKPAGGPIPDSRD